jgi:hypothetical protein
MIDDFIETLRKLQAQPWDRPGLASTPEQQAALRLRLIKAVQARRRMRPLYSEEASKAGLVLMQLAVTAAGAKVDAAKIMTASDEELEQMLKEAA